MFTVLAVKREGFPDDDRCTASADKQAQVGICAGHIHNHYEDKHTKQATCENEEVLRFQPFELNRSSNAFIDIIITHSAMD